MNSQSEKEKECTMTRRNTFSKARARGWFKPNILGCFKLTTIFLLIYVMIFTFNIWKTFSKNPVQNIDSNGLYNSNSNRQNVRTFLKTLKSKGVKANDCQIPRLKNRITISNKEIKSDCQRVKPTQRSCDTAKSLFVNIPAESCNMSEVKYYCLINETSLTVSCHQGNCETFDLGIRSLDTGQLGWTTVESKDALQSKIASLLKTDNTGYCLIRCSTDSNSVVFSYTDKNQFIDFERTQLLIMPPKPEKSSKRDTLTKDQVNVNILFIDSVSRHHLFRSLPKTVDLFEELNRGSDAMVLDFELLQAIRSRTFETLNSLLGGIIPQTEKTFGILEMPPVPLKVDGLFKLFQEAGYTTLWQEDLCFLWEWGIVKDLLVHNKSLSVDQSWKNLMKAFDEAGIDSFGMSSANCEILAQNEVRDHFHGPDTVCFNGRHQHDFLFEYLRFYQMARSRSGQPYLSFLETNVGHEDTGRRIKTLDDSLQRYLKFATKQENTLTILFSDHGNAYGEFIDKSTEGRVELYHPTLFIIIPSKLSEAIGHKKMVALTLNQNRLISHLDLHYTLRSLVTKNQDIPQENKQYLVTHDGLFQNMSTTRKCSNVPQIPPNFCICEGGESRVKNSSLYVLYAHFAVGVLNNAIQNQYRRAHKDSTRSFGGCQRLELKSFQHVRKAINENGAITITMDLLFESADPSYNSYEVFTVSVISDVTSGEMIMSSMDRLTPYSKYSVCADKSVQLKLCICNISQKTEDTQPTDLNIPQNDLLMKGDVAVIEESEDCLIRVNQESEEGFTVTLINICTHVKIQVTVSVKSDNLHLSDRRTQQCVLRPGEIRFLLVGVIADSKSPWDWSYTISFVLKKWS